MRSLLVFFLLFSSLFSLTITWREWPYGQEYVGSYFRWWYNGANYPVPCPPFSEFDTLWDFATGSTRATAESRIRPRNEASGNPPAPTTYAERITDHNGLTWMYEHKDTTGTTQWMWVYGFYAGGSQFNYNSPYNKVYQFPMSLGTHWTSNWTWNYSGLLIYEERDNTVVAEGWVRVPADTTRFYPCLVIRTYLHTYDEMGIIDERRIIHEWVVPNRGRVGGSVVTIMSVNGEVNPRFTTADYFYRQKEFYSSIDMQPPEFANTTVIPTGYYFGPWKISSTITDANGIRTDSIYYKIGNQPWQSLPHDSVRGNIYHFHIPQISAPDTIRYYLIAIDNSNQRNRGTDPENAPNSHYKFYALDPANDHRPPQITQTTIWTDTIFLGPYVVSSNVTDSSYVDSVALYYRFGSGSEQRVLPDSVVGIRYFLTIPSASPGTFIRYRIRAVDGSPNRNAAYDPASGYYSFLVLDGEPPNFSGTTIWPDTTYPGPFPISSTITDFSGINRALIFFRLGSMDWDSLLSDSVRGNLYHFHIPRVSQPTLIRYYLKAYDNSSRRNVGTDPQGAPGNFYSFFCDPQVGIGEVTSQKSFYLSIAKFNPKKIDLHLKEKGEAVIKVYNLLGKETFHLIKSFNPGDYQIKIPELPSGIYLLVIKLGKDEMKERFISFRER